MANDLREKPQDRNKSIIAFFRESQPAPREVGGFVNKEQQNQYYGQYCGHRSRDGIYISADKMLGRH